jgi:hypothetical protein
VRPFKQESQKLRFFEERVVVMNRNFEYRFMPVHLFCRSYAFRNNYTKETVFCVISQADNFWTDFDYISYWRYMHNLLKVMPVHLSVTGYQCI